MRIISSFCLICGVLAFVEEAVSRNEVHTTIDLVKDNFLLLNHRSVHLAAEILGGAL